MRSIGLFLVLIGGVLLGVSCRPKTVPSAKMEGASSGKSMTAREVALSEENTSAFALSASEGEACQPALTEDGLGFQQTNCLDGLLCVLDITNGSGTCRVPCGALNPNWEVNKESEKCGANRTCQVVSNTVPMGAYCLEQQVLRDGKCYAEEDPQACTEGRVCQQSAVEMDPFGGQSISALVCRETCPLGEKNAHEFCKSGEQCLPDKFMINVQQKEGVNVNCNPQNCSEGKDCPCDSERGYVCRIRPGAEDTKEGQCIRRSGICGVSVSGLTLKDVEEKQYQRAACNEVTGHRFCGKEAYQSDEGKTYNRGVCSLVGHFAPNLGICLNVCSATVKNKQCGVGYGCTETLAKTIFQSSGKMLADTIKIKGTGAVKTCNLGACRENEPCPEQCGKRTGGFCVKHPQSQEPDAGMCVRWIKTCESQT